METKVIPIPSQKFGEMVSQIQQVGHHLHRQLSIFDNSTTFNRLRKDQPLPVELTSDFLAGLKPLVVYLKAVEDHETLVKIKDVLIWCKERPFDGVVNNWRQTSFLGMNPAMEKRLNELIELLE